MMNRHARTRSAYAATLAMIVALVVPATASARLPAGYHGRAFVVSEPRATIDGRAYPAWQWSGTGWTECGAQWVQTVNAGWTLFRSGCLHEGEAVYAWPYAAGWHWVWTSRHGWLVARSSDLVA